MDRFEKIGKITLDYEYYPGEDFYCDGLVEDELLHIAKNHAPAEFPALIEERGSWPVLYHLSAQRENIVNWLPITKDMKVLELYEKLCEFMPEYLAEDWDNDGIMCCADTSLDCKSILQYIGDKEVFVTLIGPCRKQVSL